MMERNALNTNVVSYIAFILYKKFNFAGKSAKWSIHGLWPTQFGKIAPGYCNDTWKFEYKAVESIRDQLDIYWPDVEMAAVVETSKMLANFN